MKNLKKIITMTFLAFSLTLIAQEDNTRMDKINAIAKGPIGLCETGPQSITDLTENLKEKASLYSPYYKQKDYKSAIKFWRPLFFGAPKYSKNLHSRGMKMYKTLAKAAEGEMKETYLDSLYAIHEVRINCFGSSADYEKRKAFDWYSYRTKGNEGFVFEMFNNVHKVYIKEGSENDADPNFLLYWAKIAMKANKNAKIIDEDAVLDVYETITNIVDANLAAGNEAGAYKATLDAITEDLKKYEYLDCPKLNEMAEKRFRANPNDETTIIKAYKNLKAGGCTDTPLFTEIVTKLVEVRPSAGLYKYLASKAIKDGNESLAITYFEKAVELEDSNSEKEDLYYRIARMQIKAGSLSSAREYARKMLALNPNSGNAYMIIASTYAASGKICGSGNDFRSHTVSWAAIDTWRKAKSIDSSVAEEAQKMINRYSQYMPSKEEIFYEGLKIGASYTIDCLGVTTTIRSSN